MPVVTISSPERHQWPMTFSEQDLLKITVQCFKEELAKLIATLYAYSEYTKNNIGLIFGNMPLDNDSALLSDYGIKSGTALQMVRKVNGG